jgi:hypothetical protein
MYLCVHVSMYISLNEVTHFKAVVKKRMKKTHPYIKLSSHPTVKMSDLKKVSKKPFCLQRDILQMGLYFCEF